MEQVVKDVQELTLPMSVSLNYSKLVNNLLMVLASCPQKWEYFYYTTFFLNYFSQFLQKRKKKHFINF